MTTPGDVERVLEIERRVATLEGSMLFTEKTISERLAALENRIAVMENRQSKSDSILIDVQMKLAAVQRGIDAILAKLGDG